MIVSHVRTEESDTPIESPDAATRRRLVAVTVRWGTPTRAIWRIAQALADARASARRELTLPLHALPVDVQDYLLELAARARETALAYHPPPPGTR